MKKIFSVIIFQVIFSVCFSQGKINGHEYLDLGLPSGNKWATCNVGASKPTEAGNFYSYGSIIPAKSFNWISDNYHPISGNPKYDAARKDWGSPWEIPLKEDFEELIKYCKWEWTSINSQIGYKVIGPNGKFIFLPSHGIYTDRLLVPQESSFWSGSECRRLPDNVAEVYALFCSKEKYVVAFSTLFQGRNIRAVIKK